MSEHQYADPFHPPDRPPYTPHLHPFQLAAHKGGRSNPLIPSRGSSGEGPDHFSSQMHLDRMASAQQVRQGVKAGSGTITICTRRLQLTPREPESWPETCTAHARALVGTQAAASIVRLIWF